MNSKKPLNCQLPRTALATLALGIAMATASLTPSQAQANQDLAQSKMCLTCHQVDKKVVGPAFKDVAARYKGDKTAEAKLAGKIKAGGKGSWGEIPMPAQNVTEDEAKQLAKWVLSK